MKLKKLLVAAMAILFIANITPAQTHPDSTKAGEQMMMKNGKGMMNQNQNGMMNHDKSMTGGKKMANKIVRKGVINVKAIDKNKDGKVFQDVMDWNVISDKPGKCPLCGMTLKEVTVKQAVKNLKAHGYKTK